jgi:flavin reductase (DIM6/NTAB) family NADH-FMN oxidoreductase RutF
MTLTTFGATPMIDYHNDGSAVQMRGVTTDALATTFPRSHPVRFLLVGFHQNRVFVPTLPATLVHLHTHITAAITVIDHDMLQRVL